MLGSRMPSLSPRATLLLFFAIAAVIFVGGLRLARQQESIRVDRDREALRRFAGDAQAELVRLDALYEKHLARLARDLPNDAFEIRREANRIVGVRQCSLLHRGTSAAASDLHAQVVIGERVPIPSFAAPNAGSVRTVVLLDEAALFSGSDSGWIEEPGKPLMYWLRRSPTEVAVIMVDLRSAGIAINRWLQDWATAGFEPVRVEGGPDQFRQRGGLALAAGGEPPETRPDLLLPLRSRLGSWELASWDRLEIRTRYDTAALTASAAIAVLVALLGIVVFGQQRRTVAQAAQRVSFVNRVSHELRSPLTNIVLNVDLAAEAMAEGPSDATRRLALVQEEARRLGRLIDNVLTFSRQEQGRLHAEPRACVPAGVIAAVVEQFSASFARRGLVARLSGEAHAACLLDADALAQILGNLLSNVEKYVPCGTVEISADWVADTLRITVADEGPGIPPHAAERIFHPFERLDNRVNEGVSGTGLGLAIARDLAVAMGGSLRLAPTERGACFELRVPAPPAPAITAAA